ncbi:MAG: ribulose-phosphate 3-epimerase [Verrucomicrobiae bacterium]|nr:ribulose-phosphate 3-epimerase [Verrucomicrobiae bacterium]
MRPILIAPSLLAADPASLGEEVRRAGGAGADWLHVDIMDGHFVPNLSFGPAIVAAAKRHTHLPLDVHLMLSHPDRYIEAFARAGAALISVHVEADHDVADTLRRIKRLGCRRGVVLNPDTPFEAAEPFLEDAELVLAMTVYPGFGGQPLISGVLEKCARARSHRSARGLDFDIEVDGGVGVENAADCARAGANVLVAGTSLFAEGDMAERVRRMRAMAEAAVSSG